ncbi:MAG: tRNA (adenosine(37)-N6)-dimethylallyltransferase MiaA [Actinomycetes bacterium]
MTGARGGVVAVVGPTAAGKSALAVRLAEELDGEVVNADSMSLYRGMDIGTAKPSADQRRGVAHHLLDVWDVRGTASVVEYQQLARTAIDQVRARGRTPVVVGGSGLYVRAALDVIEFPGTDPTVRAGLLAELAEDGPGPLHARLSRLDPAAAGTIRPSDTRRVVRALEVVALTGRFRARMPDREYADPGTVTLGVRVPRAELDVRIEVRTAAMWRCGLVEEVRGLVELGLREGRTASRALGYAQVLGLLAGQYDEDQARSATIRATRRFVRRQQTWFRADPRVRWLDAGDGADESRLTGTAVQEVLRCWQRDDPGEPSGAAGVSTIDA